MANITKLGKDGYSRERKVDGNKVTCNYGLMQGSGKTGQIYVVNGAVFDFEGCTQEDILLLATARATIAVQTRLRKVLNSNAHDALDEKHYKRINVKRDVVDAERATASKKTDFEKAQSLLGKLTAEQKAELAKLLK